MGIKPAVLSIIAAAIFKLGKKALKGWELGVLGAIVIGVTVTGLIDEVSALLVAGILGMIYFYTKTNIASTKGAWLPLIMLKASVAGIKGVGTFNVFFTFLKVGAILYGSGYVLFAYLDSELVSTGLLSRQELIDAIAVGQFTPGPVLSTATFIGYQLNGVWGAIAASVGIFLPSFLFVLLLNPLVPKMRKSKLMRGFLDSVNIAAVAIMVTVLFQMGQDTLVDWRTITIAILSFVVTFGLKKVSTMWIILGGALGGYLLYML